MTCAELEPAGARPLPPPAAFDNRATMRAPILEPVAPGPGPAQPLGSSVGRAMALDDAYGEYSRRRAEGEAISLDGFCGKFPELAPHLHQMIGTHDFVEGNAQVFGDGSPIVWPLAGDTLLGFEIRRELGRGSFARVYLAAETALGGRQVALKVSSRGAGEAEKLGRLRHANVVPVYSVAQERSSGLTAICMPYLGSATLSRVAALARLDGRLPRSARAILDSARDSHVAETEPRSPAPILHNGTYVDGVLYLALQLAEALAFIHAHGVCHRDLKPSNVLLRPDGTPLLLDFNLSQNVSGESGFAGGTLAYMAPEELKRYLGLSTSPAPDPRSDLFAFGVMFFELLSGQLPFGPVPGSEASCALCMYLLERQAAGPRRLDALNPNIDRPVAALIARCLAYAPADRPTSASDIAAALRAALSPVQRARRRAPRKPVLLSAAGAALLTLAAAIAWPTAHAPTRPAQPLELGARALAARDLPQALAHFSQAADMAPDQADAFFGRARVHQAAGERDPSAFWLAREDYQKAEQRGGGGPARASMGYCLSRLGLTREAIEDYRLAIAAGHGIAAVYNNLGHSYRIARNSAEAKKCLDRAIELDPDLSEARHNRALLGYQRLVELSARLFPKRGGIRLAAAAKEQLRRELRDCHRATTDDVDCALQARPASAAPYLTAARIAALAATRGEPGAAAALRHLQDAVDRGHDPKKLAADASFDALRQLPAFQVLITRTPTAPTAHRSFAVLIDPAADAAD